MYTHIFKVTEDSLVIPIPEDLRGHTVEVKIDDLGTNGKPRPGNRHFSSIEEALSHFTAASIDTRGFKFDREEANRRR